MSERCRHRDSWLISGGSHEWCYRCGALRQMRETGIARVHPVSPWVYPVGPKKANPFALWMARRDVYRKRFRPEPPQ